MAWEQANPNRRRHSTSWPQTPSAYICATNGANVQPRAGSQSPAQQSGQQASAEHLGGSVTPGSNTRLVGGALQWLASLHRQPSPPGPVDPPRWMEGDRGIRSALARGLDPEPRCRHCSRRFWVSQSTCGGQAAPCAAGWPVVRRPHVPRDALEAPWRRRLWIEPFR